MPMGKSEEFYVGAFLAEFGVAPGGRGEFVDAQGVSLMITDDIFLAKARGRRYKVKKRGRERHVLALADTVKRPDEIYETWVAGQKGRRLRRRYVARWAGADGMEFETQAVFESINGGEWRGVTAYKPNELGDVLKRAARLGENARRVYPDKD